LRVIRESIKVQSLGTRPAFHNITERVRDIVQRAGIKEGFCLVYSHHTTCSVMIQENSFDETYSGLEYLQQDLLNIFEKIIPTCRVEGQYMHPGPKLTEFSKSVGEDKPFTLNTDGHLRSVFVGRSETIVLSEGQLDLGEFGQIYFIDFDQTRARERTIQVQIIGE